MLTRRWSWPRGALAAVLLVGCQAPDDGAPRAVLSVPEAMTAGGIEGYERAVEPRPFDFPDDHGPHPGFRTEWWYFTGNLEAPDGRRLGYQLTLFRNALAPPGEALEARASAWATRHAWLAHFAVTDAGTGTFRSADRLARGAVGLAGAEVGEGGLRAWVGDWSVEPVPATRAGGEAGGGLGTLRLRASQEGAAVDIVVTPLGRPVLHGDRGLSKKGGGEGNASYYYSLPRLATRGTVRLEGEHLAVEGLSWLDREWSTSALGTGQVGWDWFSLQLSDGRDLMLFRLRRRGGEDDPASSGTLVEAGGETRHLRAGATEVEVLDRWRSPRSGALYPSSWRIRIPAARLDLTLTPLVADQELDVGFRYWEGAVEVTGTSGGGPVAGRGYAELTGYAEAAADRR